MDTWLLLRKLKSLGILTDHLNIGSSGKETNHIFSLQNLEIKDNAIRNTGRSLNSPDCPAFNGVFLNT